MRQHVRPATSKRLCSTMRSNPPLCGASLEVPLILAGCSRASGASSPISIMQMLSYGVTGSSAANTILLPRDEHYDVVLGKLFSIAVGLWQAPSSPLSGFSAAIVHHLARFSLLSEVGAMAATRWSQRERQNNLKRVLPKRNSGSCVTPRRCQPPCTSGILWTCIGKVESSQ